MSIQLFIRIATLLMFVFPGVLSLYVSIKGSNWFFGGQSNRYLVQSMGRKWARVLYFILGVLLLGAALMIWMDPRGLMEEV
ncbi:Imm17 family immunity protein [Porphyromonadaceae bacterium W3.11]|nr:Imm17 family immunity protein [Porphyromonadaceae bacterium W3.11]